MSPKIISFFSSLKSNESKSSLWRFSPPKSLEVKRIDPRKSRIRISKNMSLEFSDTTVGDTGTYICIQDNIVKAKYYIDVVFEEPNRDLIHGMKSASKPLKDWKLQEHNINVKTEWTDWSACSRCGKVGIRRKFGVCKVHVSF